MTILATASYGGDPLAYYGKRIIEEHHAALLKVLPPVKVDPKDADPFGLTDDKLRLLPELKVGILGAGAGGLYTALMLDSLGIEYEIIESTGRTGGRLSTFHFRQGEKYDYYEAGAMRFPLPKKDDKGQFKNGTMKRLAELIEYGPLNDGPHKLKDKLIPYYYNVRPGSKPGFNYFNGILEPVSSKPKGPFDAQAMNVGAAYVKTGADAISNDVLNPFIKMMIDDLTTGQTAGWDVLKANDTHSARSYMASKYMPSDSLNLPPTHLPSDVISWCQLLGGFAGGYDRALTEAVFESLAFAQVGGSDYGDVDWKCFDGGSQTLSNSMEAYINSKGVTVQFHQRVTAISQGTMVVSVPENRIEGVALPSGVKRTDSEAVDHVIKGGAPSSHTRLVVPCVTVTTATPQGHETRKFSHVVSTLPLPILRTVDLNDAGLNTMQKNALRALDYGPSVKIAILFKSNWWFTKMGIFGGQSFTDLPIRTIVYPSYGVDSSPCKVLIASYTWTTDAFRLSALSAGNEQDVLKELVLRNLAEAHGRLDSEITFEFLMDQYVDMNVQDWNHDVHTMGAFAFFSPGEFENLYASLNVPAADNRLHFAGEAISTRHAWVVGALDSAWKAVYQYLKVTDPTKIPKFKQIWGENVEWTGNASLVDPGDYDDDGPGVPDLLDQHLGLVTRAVQSGIIGQGN